MTGRIQRRYCAYCGRDGSSSLRIWISNNLFRPNQAPVVNVVAVILLAVSILPVWPARLLGGAQAAESRL